jgi:hypothetical protein
MPISELNKWPKKGEIYANPRSQDAFPVASPVLPRPEKVRSFRKSGSGHQGANDASRLHQEARKRLAASTGNRFGCENPKWHIPERMKNL